MENNDVGPRVIGPSNDVEGEELHFKYMDSSSDKVVEFKET